MRPSSMHFLKVSAVCRTVQILLVMVVLQCLELLYQEANMCLRSQMPNWPYSMLYVAYIIYLCLGMKSFVWM